jgi:hypothetical protein
LSKLPSPLTKSEDVPPIVTCLPAYKSPVYVKSKPAAVIIVSLFIVPPRPTGKPGPD